MDKNFHYSDAPAPQPVIFDMIFAEKVGGGLVKNAAFDRHPGLAVSADGEVIKGARLYEAITNSASTLKVEKDHGFVTGDFIASGNVAVKVTKVDSTHDDYDIITASGLKADLEKGAVLYQASEASESAAEPKYEPVFVLGTFLPANCGDELAKLVNGANVRKETILFPAEIAEKMNGIHVL